MASQRHALTQPAHPRSGRIPRTVVQQCVQPPYHKGPWLPHTKASKGRLLACNVVVTRFVASICLSHTFTCINGAPVHSPWIQYLRCRHPHFFSPFYSYRVNAGILEYFALPPHSGGAPGVQNWRPSLVVKFREISH
ncbi:hypothetical protein LIA77_10702 [Sarocladium implicatum]|nr:hypothetical protein LIA77_10702 [Sarocladium implicatum]